MKRSVYPKRFDENVNVQAFVGWLRDEVGLYARAAQANETEP